jgi:hypothetical protein
MAAIVPQLLPASSDTIGNVKPATIEKLALLTALSEQGPPPGERKPKTIPRPKIVCAACGQHVAAWQFDGRNGRVPFRRKKCIACRKAASKAEPHWKLVLDYCIGHPADFYDFDVLAAALSIPKKQIRLSITAHSKKAADDGWVFEPQFYGFRLTRRRSMK